MAGIPLQLLHLSSLTGMLTIRRALLCLSSLTVALFLLNSFYSWHNQQQPVSSPPTPSSLADARSQLWQQLHPLLEQYAPDCPPPVLRGGAGLQRFDAVHASTRRSHIANVDEVQEPMQAAHDGFVDAIRNLNLDRTYVPGTVGIVSSAGGSYMPTFLVTLRLLRRTGSNLPVELFLKDRSEYEPSICEEILPPLGVTCLVLSDILAGQDTTTTTERSTSTIEGFQIKSFAMLFSSFEKFLWLDADCIPLHDPAELLTAEPFTSTGFVTWPDFWANTAAPAYFTISRQPDPPSTARQATEAGMILVSRDTHSLPLLLAAYYNYYGPDYYYTLLDQGAPGAGDKDTFLHAVTALNQTFYAVSETVVDLGNITPWNAKVAINAGYGQADPVQDHALTKEGKWRAQDSSVAKPPRVFFVHAGDPEFNPGKGLLGSKLVGFDGKPTRLWTYPPEAMQRLGDDVERVVWEETMSVTCTMQLGFASWKGKTGLCEGVQAHWRDVFENPDVAVPGVNS